MVHDTTEDGADTPGFDIRDSSDATLQLETDLLKRVAQ